MDKTTIALIDCDSFFVSCEQLMDPRLKNKPVCVMSNNDSCVVARSREAKQLGIKMGMPMFQAKKMFPDAVYLSGNLPFYYEISARVMGVARDFSPIVEVYSVDECFIDFSGLQQYYKCSHFEMAKILRENILKQVGVPVSIGIAPTKTLAKLASEKAKVRDGVYQINNNQIISELQNTKIAEIWGVGANTNNLLSKYGIINSSDFVLKPDSWLKNRLGRRGIEIKSELLGHKIYQLKENVELPKSIQKTSTFAKNTNDRFILKKSITYHVHRACKKLRALGLKTRSVSFMLKTRHFNVLIMKKNLLNLTNCEFEINRMIDEFLDEFFDENMLYRSSGVIFDNLTATEQSQLSLFNNIENSEKYNKLTTVWDKLENKFGKKGISIIGI